jgi:hypothetical protein
VRRCSHWQQSLQRWHFSQRWFWQVSLVQYTQISVEGSPQMLHAKATVSLTDSSPYFALVFFLAGAGRGACWFCASRQRCASRSTTANSCSF